MKISGLYGAILLGKDKKTRGTILGICCANGEISGYICFDEREKEFFVETSGISVKRDGIYLLEKPCARAEGKSLRLGAAAYSSRGKYLGYLKDITFKGKKLLCAYIGGRRYPIDKITFGDALIVCGEEEERGRAELAVRDAFIGALCSEL